MFSLEYKSIMVINQKIIMILFLTKSSYSEVIVSYINHRRI